MYNYLEQYFRPVIFQRSSKCLDMVISFWDVHHNVWSDFFIPSSFHLLERKAHPCPSNIYPAERSTLNDMSSSIMHDSSEVLVYLNVRVSRVWIWTCWSRLRSDCPLMSSLCCRPALWTHTQRRTDVTSLSSLHGLTRAWPLTSLSLPGWV